MTIRGNSTHRVAGLLEQVARLLRAGPDISLRDAEIGLREDRESLHLAGIAVNLSTLASLSKLKKEAWVQLIEHYKLPVAVKKSDSVRDLLGRLLSFLETDEGARERLRNAAPPTGDVSSELAKTLQHLLGPR